MSEKEKQIVCKLAELLPVVSDLQKAQIEGVIIGAGLVANKKQESKEQKEGE